MREGRERRGREGRRLGREGKGVKEGRKVRVYKRYPLFGSEASL